MIALVTGATGFVGRTLVKRLERGFAEVRAAVRKGKEGSMHGFPRNVHATPLDFTEQSSVERALDGVDVVFHLAARLRGAQADIVSDTVVASEHLFDAIESLPRPPRLVLLGSFGVYRTSETTGRLLDEGFPIEDHPERRDPYSLAKWLQERVAWSRHVRGKLDLVVVRAGTIWGHGRSPVTQRVGVRIGDILLLLGGDNRVPLCHVDGVADALVLAFAAGAPGSIFNLVDDSPPTARHLAMLAKERLGSTVIRVPFRAVVRGAALAERIANSSRDQLVAPLTEYRAKSLYTPREYSNERIRALGWNGGAADLEMLAACIQ